jgi:hypothetical protein
MSGKIRPFWLTMSVLFANGLVFATTPLIAVISPKDNSTSTSPVIDPRALAGALVVPCSV